MHIHLQITGSLMMILALLHASFPKYFKWKQELNSLSTINREMMYVHTLFIAITVFLMGYLCMTSATELLNTTLGKRISLAIGFFWMLRLYVQFFGYSSNLWKGKAMETAIHILFSIIWTYFTVIFILVYFG